MSLGPLSHEPLGQLSKVATSLEYELLEFPHLFSLLLGIPCCFPLPCVELREASSQHLAIRNEIRPEMPQVRRQFVVKQKFSCRFNSIVAEMAKQCFAEVRSDQQSGFIGQELLHPLYGSVQVNLAEQVAGVPQRSGFLRQSGGRLKLRLGFSSFIPIPILVIRWDSVRWTNSRSACSPAT